MKPEEKARKNIDQQLEASGWILQDMQNLNLYAGTGVAIREFPLATGSADYLLFINGKAAGVIEAKPEGTTLSGVADQSAKYIMGFPKSYAHYQLPIPYAYESTGVETFFRDERDPEPCSRRVFSFHRPETLAEWLNQPNTLRTRLKNLPPLHVQGLRDCQIEAINNLERSFAMAKPRALIQMATGSGKTYTAVSFIYRLIKYANARRILFLVDRSNLGRQTRNEFQQFVTPDDGRKFTDLYNIQHLSSNTLDKVCRVTITTIQRLYSMLTGETEFDSSLEEVSAFELFDGKAKEVSYNPQIPIETFDFVVTDECHRSIYGLWRQVLEYFDAFTVGLTATPSKQTMGYFNQNLVMEYSHERAVADGVNVGFEVYRIRTNITEQGSKVDAGFYIDKRNKITRQKKWEQLDEDFEYAANQLDRDVVAVDQIRTVIKSFKENLFTDLFPGRHEVPKTLIFAKDDSHAEDIVQIVKEEFGKGNDFCKKITYKTIGEKPEDLISSFRNSPNPRIAVTVDMISTGTDIRPLECLLFMRDVKSRVYFEQMKGRGSRTISTTELESVTGDARHKTHFIIVDAVGVTEGDKTDSRPLEREKSISFEKLLFQIAAGNREEDMLTSLAGRLAALDREITEEDRQEITRIADGQNLKQMANSLLDAVNVDKQIEKAKDSFKTENPSEDQIKQSSEELANSACMPFHKPELRNILVAIKKKNEQIIDTISKDTLITTGFDEQAKEKAQTVISTFKQFIEDNKDELTAIQIIYSKPYAQRHLTYDAIAQLATAITKPPYQLNQELIWRAYEQLEKDKVQGAGTQKLLTDIVSLIRFATGKTSSLEPFSASVDARFVDWLATQKIKGVNFNSEQMEWLVMIKKHITTSASISIDDFENVPFSQRGGAIKASKLFKELDKILEDLNGALI